MTFSLTHSAAEPTTLDTTLYGRRLQQASHGLACRCFGVKLFGVLRQAPQLDESPPSARSSLLLTGAAPDALSACALKMHAQNFGGKEYLRCFNAPATYGRTNRDWVENEPSFVAVITALRRAFFSISQPEPKHHLEQSLHAAYGDAISLPSSLERLPFPGGVSPPYSTVISVLRDRSTVSKRSSPEPPVRLAHIFPPAPHAASGAGAPQTHAANQAFRCCRLNWSMGTIKGRAS